MKQLIGLLLVFVAMLGITDASYLTYEKYSGVIPTCGTGFDCGQVLTSPYSHLGPIPLSALGVLFYATVLIFAASYVVEFDLGKMINIISPVKFTMPEYLFMLGTVGISMSIIFVGLMAFVIEAWCLFCLFSALSSLVIFMLSSLLRFKYHD